MSEPPSEREQARAKAVDAIEHTLSTIESQGREPDSWERLHLTQAISWLHRGGYNIATVDAGLALTPPSERGEAGRMTPDPTLDHFDMSALRAGFLEAAAEPLCDDPAFGPIIFTRRS
jgi:hypothetical protein